MKCKQNQNNYQQNPTELTVGQTAQTKQEVWCEPERRATENIAMHTVSQIDRNTGSDSWAVRWQLWGNIIIFAIIFKWQEVRFTGLWISTQERPWWQRREQYLLIIIVCAIREKRIQFDWITQIKYKIGQNKLYVMYKKYYTIFGHQYWSISKNNSFENSLIFIGFRYL